MLSWPSGRASVRAVTNEPKRALRRPVLHRGHWLTNKAPPIPTPRAALRLRVARLLACSPAHQATIDKAKDLHPKLLGGAFVFFALGATGGMLSLIMQASALGCVLGTLGIRGRMCVLAEGWLRRPPHKGREARTARAPAWGAPAARAPRRVASPGEDAA